MLDPRGTGRVNEQKMWELAEFIGWRGTTGTTWETEYAEICKLFGEEPEDGLSHDQLISLLNTKDPTCGNYMTTGELHRFIYECSPDGDDSDPAERTSPESKRNRELDKMKRKGMLYGGK